MAKAQAIAEAKAKLAAAQKAKREADIKAAQTRAQAQASISVPGVSQTPRLQLPGASPLVGAAGTTGGTASSAAPGVITQLNDAAPVANSTAQAPAPTSAAPLNTLERYIQERNLSFNSAVLGPLNTAVFKTDRGFVVVSVGQNIPDTNINVREVSASSATLALDNTAKTLQLDKR
ncbi:hypothetical protein EHF33_08140 [Deinococcus psychrotolerans]|uniref:Uncharacterized protein n=1 Tax=Deinococcus psychrotolerans TaxID=2489213 RepID=A0A3G8YCK5_9DEIO|nr:hypothetical protein EHF33_08140 [Deinococcus psychrotolerans]